MGAIVVLGNVDSLVCVDKQKYASYYVIVRDDIVVIFDWSGEIDTRFNGTPVVQATGRDVVL
ncbi:hypothetical protein KSB_41640 [Ktedonobacter robiniae]|uniref:Uncharacterized protein n=1 Tax=Ktedonobacter robiniae TaxID=2778365 RepID=A0ABQ3USH7_9CHLR|nr:hypothetical protein KSB_41640 [Ktedonobacter robiniae]